MYTAQHNRHGPVYRRIIETHGQLTHSILNYLSMNNFLLTDLNF
jgi:hypothetical protein